MGKFLLKTNPFGRVLRGETIDRESFSNAAKDDPWSFVADAFTILMMIVGAYTIGHLAYEAGLAVGMVGG